MTFIAVFIALLIERFFDWSNFRGWQWYERIQRLVYNRLTNQSPYLILAIQMLPFVIAIALIECTLQGWWYGFLKLLFQFAILLYCMGPKNLWADTFIHINSIEHGDIPAPVELSNPPSHTLLGRIFIEANERLFAVVFWFAVLGPAGAVLYRLLTLSLPETETTAHKIQAMLDWVPVRLFTFLFALAGHFTRVLSIWKKHLRLGFSENNTILAECGVAALDDDSHQEREALNLLDRVFVIVLVIVAAVVLVL